MIDVPTPQDSTDFVKEWQSRHFEFALLEPYASPDCYTKGWRTDLPFTSPFGRFNVALRSRSTFAIHLSVDNDVNGRPLHELGSYQFLIGLGDTLRFSTTTDAVFVYAREPRLSELSEHRQGAKVTAGVLKDARLVSESGFLAFGVSYDDNMKPVRVKCEGELEDVSKFPDLVTALSKTGRFGLYGL